jgi:hypothetical protein
VVDRANALKYQRKRYLELAKEHGYHTRIIWLNVDRELCIQRCLEQADHPSLQSRFRDKVACFFRHFQIPSQQEADHLEIVGLAPTYVPVEDLTGRIGSRRHVIVGDIHGCLDELLELLRRLEFDRRRDVLLSVGDIVDRGPKIKETIEYLFGLPEFHLVLGNHEEKLRRHLNGRRVKMGGGLQSTVDAFENKFPPELKDRLNSLPLILKTPSGYVVHAGFDPERIPEEQNRDDCLFMRHYGGRDYVDAVHGTLWYTLWPREASRVFFGHIPDVNGPCTSNVVSLDGGCVFGGVLKAFDSRDGRVHSVLAQQSYKAA